MGEKKIDERRLNGGQKRKKGVGQGGSKGM